MTNLDKVHEKCLQLLDKLIEVCDKYNLQWFADSGTLLGAIRKGEIIPWDDDIDVIMPRKDYNKLLEVGKIEFTAPYFLQNMETDCWNNFLTKLRLDNTTSLQIDRKHKDTDSFYYNFHKGIFIDIFVLDEVCNDDIFETRRRYLRMLHYFSEMKHNGKDKLNYNVVELFKASNKMFDEINDNYESNGLLVNMYFEMSNKHQNAFLSKELYSSYFEIDFKGLQHKLRIPVGYVDILKTWYGNDWYIEKQIPAAHTCFYDAEHDYSYYSNLSYEEYEKLFN